MVLQLRRMQLRRMASGVVAVAPLVLCLVLVAPLPLWWARRLEAQLQAQVAASQAAVLCVELHMRMMAPWMVVAPLVVGPLVVVAPARPPARPPVVAQVLAVVL